MIYTFHTPNGSEWSARFDDGWVHFEERATRRTGAGPAETPFDPTDAELSDLLLNTWLWSRKKRRTTVE